MKPSFNPFPGLVIFFGLPTLGWIVFGRLLSPKRFVSEDHAFVRITKRGMGQRILFLLATMALTLFLDELVFLGIPISEESIIIPLVLYLAYYQGLGFFWLLGFTATADCFYLFVEGMLGQLLFGWDPVSWWRGMMGHVPLVYSGFLYTVLDWGELEALVGGMAITLGILLPLWLILSRKYEPPGSK